MPSFAGRFSLPEARTEGEGSLRELMNRLGYRFAREELLETALTTPALGAEKHRADYQRLEFLGDAVLELAISQHLFSRYPEAREGQLTFARSKLVREETLSRAARTLGLGRYIRITPGMEKEGARDNPSILCDVTEAVIAAVYLDGGLEEAFALVGRLLREPLSGDPFERILDAKSRLNILAQKDGGPTPAYETLRVEGTAPNQVFYVRVLLGGEPLCEAEGRSKQAAQQAAAERAITLLNERQCGGCD